MRTLLISGTTVLGSNIPDTLLRAVNSECRKRGNEVIEGGKEAEIKRPPTFLLQSEGEAAGWGGQGETSEDKIPKVNTPVSPESMMTSVLDSPLILKART
jgi:hypothetical protein